MSGLPSVPHLPKVPSGRNGENRSNQSHRQSASICSSEFYSRVEALQLQLKEERKRRENVEKTIRRLVSDNTETNATVSAAPLLTEAALYLLQNRSDAKPDERSIRSGVGAVASSQRSSSKSVQENDKPVVTIRKAPSSFEWAVAKHLKPPLPPQAKGNSNTEATPHRFSRKRVDAVDVYVTKQRHEKRMQMLHDFQLPPF